MVLRTSDYQYLGKFGKLNFPDFLRGNKKPKKSGKFNKSKSRYIITLNISYIFVLLKQLAYRVEQK